MDGFSKPTARRSRMNSCSSSAPATHPIHNSMLLLTGPGTSPRTTTSDTANRPPGLRTRNASARTFFLSADRLITQLEMMTSTDASGRGMRSISPLRNSTFVAPARSLFALASASISSVMSRPYTLPVGPTRFAERRTSIPPPDPRSSTVSPSCSSARAVGFPQPSVASIASAGMPAFCCSSSRYAVIGSHVSVVDPQHALVPQQLVPVAPALTRIATAPYCCLTCSLRVVPSCSLILLILSSQQSLLMYWIKKNQAQQFLSPLRPISGFIAATSSSISSNASRSSS